MGHAAALKIDLDQEQLALAAEQLAGHGGLMHRVAEGLPAGHNGRIPIQIVHGGQVIADATGELAMSSPDGQCAFTFDGDTTQRLLELLSIREDAQNIAPNEQSSQTNLELTNADARSRAEKIRLAKTGDLDTRRKILRDNDRGLHPHVLQNPGLSGTELASHLRVSNPGAELIGQIVRRQDLMASPELVEVIVFHPRTPIPIAVQWTAQLRMDVVRRIAKSGGLRLPIVKAARQRVQG